MAKSKRAAKPAGPKPADAGPKSKHLGLKCGPDFEAWLERFAKFKRVNKSALLEHAVIAYAKAEGFDEEPPER